MEVLHTQCLNGVGTCVVLFGDCDSFSSIWKVSLHFSLFCMAFDLFYWMERKTRLPLLCDHELIFKLSVLRFNTLYSLFYV